MLLNLDWQEFKMEQDDECFTMMIKPLDFPSYQRILAMFDIDAVASDGKMSDKQQEKIAREFNPLTNPKMREVLAEVLPKHVKDLDGLKLQIDGEIRPATIDDIVGISQLLVMATTIMIKIFGISTIVGGGRTESKKQSLKSSEVIG